MSAYTQFSQGWLEDPTAIRIVLAEVTVYDVVAATDTVLYVSNANYITSDGSVWFNSILRNTITVSESISDEGSISISFTDLELDNPNGELDYLLDSTKYIWTNRSVKLYYGDASWVTTSLADLRSKFWLIFNGVVNDIDSRSRTSVNIKIRDKVEFLNTPITDSKLDTYGTWPGGQQNADSIKPLVFGEVHNISPMLIDPATLEYMVHNGAIESVIEIRDNGVPIYTVNGNTSGAVVDLNTGKFKLTSPSVGTITASVQGAKTSTNLSTGTSSATYVNNIANIIATIATQYGKASTRLVAADLDLTNLSSFASSNTQAVGYYSNNGETTITICQDLANSIGANVYINRLGQLQILQYGAGYSDGSLLVTSTSEADMQFDTFSISRRVPVVSSTQLGYAKNWTVQEGLTTAIPQQHKASFATEFYTTTATNSSVNTLYKLDADPVQKDTYLIVDTDAVSEATRLKNFYSTQRTVYRFTGTSRLLSLKLGQALTVLHYRFNLYNGGAGVSGQVVTLVPNWSAGTVDVEVII